MGMLELKPFLPLPSVRVRGNLTLSAENLRLQFELQDPENQVLDALKPLKATNWPRADELWKTTCFECFLGERGSAGYWELNLSPNSERWALYRFEGYRAPQPPTPSQDFDLKNIEVTPAGLRCELKPQTPFKNFEAVLTAVIRTSNGLSYFSLHHRPEKPDFHWREGFVLRFT